MKLTSFSDFKERQTELAMHVQKEWKKNLLGMLIAVEVVGGGEKQHLVKIFISNLLPAYI